MAALNPFDDPGVPSMGRVVIYHHQDGFDAPAIVMATRGIDKHGYKVNPDILTEESIVSINETAGPLVIESHLTVLRPGKVEWHWASESDRPRGWSWPKTKHQIPRQS